MFCEHGAGLVFKQFIEGLTLLQDGTYTQKIDMICELFKEGRSKQKMVMIEPLVNFLLVSMPQDISHTEVAEEEFRKLFAEGEKSKELVFAKYMSMDVVKQKLRDCQGAQEVKEILRCVL